MLQTSLLSIVLTLCIFSSNAQTSDVQNWTQNHPSVLLLSSDDASSEMLEQLDAKNVLYIVYQDEILLSDIEAFEAKNKPVKTTDLDLGINAEIKKWKVEHPDVKIIKRTLYDQMDPTKQAVYHSANALILLGETITLEDIQNYE